MTKIVIPIFNKNKYRLVTIDGDTINATQWVKATDTGSVYEGAASLIQPMGQEVIDFLIGYEEALKNVVTQVGMTLPPIPYSTLVDVCGNIRDNKFKDHVDKWAKSYIWETKLDTKRPKYEIECWHLIPLSRFSVEEREFTDEEGENSKTYWLIEDGDKGPIDPNDVSHKYWYTEDLEEDDETYYGFDNKSDAEECAQYLNIECQGVCEDDGYPEEGWEFCWPLTVDILQENDIAVYDYDGPEGELQLADLSGYSSGLDKKLSKLCAHVSHKHNYLIDTEFGPRYVDPFS